MAWWEWLLDISGIVLLLLLGYGAALVARRRLLARHGGTFELSHRLTDDAPGHGWVLGMGRYSGERLEWFRVFTLWPQQSRGGLRSPPFQKCQDRIPAPVTGQ